VLVLWQSGNAIISNKLHNANLKNVFVMICSPLFLCSQ
jgi:hypothetical protein